jgi:hypothetical protein
MSISSGCKTLCLGSADGQCPVEQVPGFIGPELARSQHACMGLMQPCAREYFCNRRRTFAQGSRGSQQSKLADGKARPCLRLFPGKCLLNEHCGGARSREALRFPP